MISIFDNDLYKFTIQQAILLSYPDVRAKYKLYDRSGKLRNIDPKKIKLKFANCDLYNKRVLSHIEKYYTVYPQYKKYLLRYTINIDNLKITENPFGLSIEGNWADICPLEVPLLYTINELYNSQFEKINYSEYLKRSVKKFHKLEQNDCKFIEFGTRRRYSRSLQKNVIELAQLYCPSTFLGTSNVYFSYLMGRKPYGTIAHEWYMGVYGLNQNYIPNKKPIDSWLNIYPDNNLISLTDTFTSNLFFNQISKEQWNNISGFRQDSGNPYDFINLYVDKCRQFNANVDEKIIIFSDSLTVDKCIELNKYCKGKGFSPIFGIGTHFTNDTPNRLDIVIKLDEVNGNKVAKLSDNPNKSTGDLDVVKNIRNICNEYTI